MFTWNTCSDTLPLLNIRLAISRLTASSIDGDAITTAMSFASNECIECQSFAKMGMLRMTLTVMMMESMPSTLIFSMIENMSSYALTTKSRFDLDSSDKAIAVGGTTLPAGKYSLYVHIPESGDWSLVVNKDMGIALVKIFAEAPDAMKEEPWPYITNYTDKIKDKEVGRTKMTKGSSESSEERLKIGLSNDGTLTMSWGTENWSTKIEPKPAS